MGLPSSLRQLPYGCEGITPPFHLFLQHTMIKDAIANIARNREVLHFLSCIARFLGRFSGLPTSRQTGLLPTSRQPPEFTSAIRALYGQVKSIRKYWTDFPRLSL